VAKNSPDDVSFKRNLFLESLRSHKLYSNTIKMDFKSGITLNVVSIYQTNTYLDPGVISVKPQRLFSNEQDRLQTTYMYWQDSESKLRVLERDDVVGNKEEASKMQLMLNMCGLTLSSP